MEFFNKFGNNDNGNQLNLLATEMQNILQNAVAENGRSFRICSALYNEHIGQYQKALETWSSSEEWCASERIIAILKKSGGTKDKIE